MSVHEQFAEDLSLYALEALEGDERLALERHLLTCAACRRELEQLRADSALLAFSAAGATPPEHSRERLMKAIAKEPRRVREARPVQRRPVWRRALQWGISAATVVIVLLLSHQNADLQQHVSRVENRSRGEIRQLIQANQLIAALTSPDAERFILVSGKTPPQPQGKTIYLRNSGTLLFLASNMPQLPPQKTYELWLIPTTGAALPAGLFKPDAHGNASVIKPPLPSGVEAKTFAITVEPEAGSPAPTTQPIMVGLQG
jgi:anti-sigma-K factor RskA